MLFNPGKVIRQLRLSHNLQAKDLYRDLLNRSTYVKFEKGAQDTGITNFLEISKRLSDDPHALEEHLLDQLVIKTGNMSHADLTKAFHGAFTTQNLQRLRHLETIYHQLYEETKFMEFYRFWILSKALLEFWTNGVLEAETDQQLQGIIRQLKVSDFYTQLDGRTLYYLYPLLPIATKYSLLKRYIDLMSPSYPARLTYTPLANTLPELTYQGMLHSLREEETLAFKQFQRLLQKLEPTESEFFYVLVLEISDAYLAYWENEEESQLKPARDVLDFLASAKLEVELERLLEFKKLLNDQPRGKDGEGA